MSKKNTVSPAEQAKINAEIGAILSKSEPVGEAAEKFQKRQREKMRRFLRAIFDLIDGDPSKYQRKGFAVVLEMQVSELFFSILRVAGWPANPTQLSQLIQKITESQNKEELQKLIFTIGWPKSGTAQKDLVLFLLEDAGQTPEILAQMQDFFRRNPFPENSQNSHSSKIGKFISATGDEVAKYKDFSDGKEAANHVQNFLSLEKNKPQNFHLILKKIFLKSVFSKPKNEAKNCPAPRRRNRSGSLPASRSRVAKGRKKVWA